ncbi:MAG: hypothetical protein GY913_14135 [Proteobacteria bacterium]|nr:hypothetical protein [Pseudomonadota bacterium]MCP4918048.1 hypothetical protein [Pseudomonadota bacterium]
MSERSSPITSWEEHYTTRNVEEMPWFHAELDPELERALEAWLSGPVRILDLGTGPGTQAFEVVSVEDCVYQGNNDPLPRALFFVLRRRATPR